MADAIRRALIELFAEFGRRYDVRRDPAFLQVRDYCLRPGKYLRSLLLLHSYCGYARVRPTGRLYRWAAALEILQDFILIHDDLVDAGTLRRTGPALQYALAALHGQDLRRGSALALVFGDVLFAFGLKQFLTIAANPKAKERALAVLLDTAVLTGLGEMNDVQFDIFDSRLTREDIYTMYDKKTGYYSFVLPLVAGAILAGQSGREIKKLTALGLALGRAFQLADDLLDVTPSSTSTGKTAHSDVHMSKATLISHAAYQAASPAERSRMQRIFAKRKKTATDIAYLQGLYRRVGALARVRQEIDRYTGIAARRLRTIGLHKREKELLGMLLKGT